MKARRHSKAKVQRALAMLREGKSRAVVAKAVRMPIPTVRYHGVTAGIVSPRSFYGQRRAFAPGSRPFIADDATIIALRGRWQEQRPNRCGLGPPSQQHSLAHHDARADRETRRDP